MVDHVLYTTTGPLLPLHLWLLPLLFRLLQKVAAVALSGEMVSKLLFLVLSTLVAHTVFHDNPNSKKIEYD